MKERAMQFGMIGLGRMGGNMVRRLMRSGHTCVVHDRSPQAVETLVKEGATGASPVAEFVKPLDPIFAALAPGPGDIGRTPGREKLNGTAEEGYLHCGPNGAGHFVKMIHNGIEYGLMAAYAEGLSILRNANIGKASHENDAETTPLRNPEHYQYDFNLADITELWRRGSVVSSWLLDLTAQSMAGDPGLEKFGGKVADSGEGRWTVQAANDLGIPAHVLTAALFERFSSRGLDLFQNKVLSAMRFGFGGHVEKK